MEEVVGRGGHCSPLVIHRWLSVRSLVYEVYVWTASGYVRQFIAMAYVYVWISACLMHSIVDFFCVCECFGL